MNDEPTTKAPPNTKYELFQQLSCILTCAVLQSNAELSNKEVQGIIKDEIALARGDEVSEEYKEIRELGLATYDLDRYAKSDKIEDAYKIMPDLWRFLWAIHGLDNNPDNVDKVVDWNKERREVIDSIEDRISTLEGVLTRIRGADNIRC